MTIGLAGTLPTLDIRREPLPCKVCGASSLLDGVVDFNKSCSELWGVRLPLRGAPVYYHRCPDCGVVFTVAFDRWAATDFQRHIYNDGYATIDPEYEEARPVANARMVANFAARGQNLRILDYGGGNGRLARELVRLGLCAVSWDTMEPVGTRPMVETFDLVTSFEVVEHSPTPVETFTDALSFVRPGGVMLFSTLTIDALPPGSAHHWYISPRNGHVTIHTSRSLALLAAMSGRRIHSFSNVFHLCLAETPAWLV